MAFLGMVFKKIIRNMGLVLCLLAGLVMAVALISSVPTYTGGMMEKTLSRELTQYQLDSGNYPGNYSISSYLSDDKARARASLEKQDLSPLEDEKIRTLFADKIGRFEQLSQYIETHTASQQILPIRAQALYRCTNPYVVER